MRRVIMLAQLSGILALAGSFARAQEVSPAQELRELRQAIQLQSKQIELLTEQIGRLTRALESGKAAETGAGPLAPGAEAARPPAESTLEAPRAELVVKADAVPAGVKHVVAKGETLTSIAKQYNIPIADLKNANKIENDRKLQIGQVLTVPPAKTPETPEKKENP